MDPLSEPTPSPDPTPGGGGGEERWIETKEGGLFFLNALLIFPWIMVLIPLLTRVFVRGVVGGLPRESVIVDTFPAMTEYLLPRAGWLLVIPVGLALHTLRVETRSLPRVALGIFLALHLIALGWTVGVWTGLLAPTLPGGAPLPAVPR